MEQLFYSWLLRKPHFDKEGLEALFLRASSNHPSSSTIHLPPTHFLEPEKFSSITEGFLPELIIVRPALLTGGEEPALGREKTKVGEEVYTYTVRRSEIGRFIAEDCVPGRDDWVGKLPVVGY